MKMPTWRRLVDFRHCKYLLQLKRCAILSLLGSPTALCIPTKQITQGIANHFITLLLYLHFHVILQLFDRHTRI